jgi:hypothetical protein
MIAVDNDRDGASPRGANSGGNGFFREIDLAAITHRRRRPRLFRNGGSRLRPIETRFDDLIDALQRSQWRPSSTDAETF